MKRAISLILATMLSATMFSGCGSKPAASSKPVEPAPGSTATPSVAAPSVATGNKGNVEITVVTNYGADDGNRGNYETAYKAYEAATGNKVLDNSGTSNEQWKAKILSDFQTGAEPDVLFFFNNADSNPLVEGGKVVPIDEIRQEYPEYASNMVDEKMGASPLDGKNYSVPVNGIWEGLFVNKKVLADAGVAVPGADYTWDQFLQDCETIKEKGYTPIAVSLQEVPHYWFEYTVFNNSNPSNHFSLPANASDERGKAWAAGFEDIKTLYDKGYMPTNTLTATDPETCQLMVDNKAAFLIDGSWKLGWFQENAENVDDFTITYVPGKGERKATDVISGLTAGYYITRKAWDDPEKREACVKFVEMMTTDEVVSTFGATAVTALKNGTTPPAEKDSLVEAALAFTKGSTNLVAPVQDLLGKTARSDLFVAVKDMVTAKVTPSDAIDKALTTTDAPASAAA